MTQQEGNKALALHYNGKDTPTVLATGKGDIADEIIEIARQFEIPIMENRELLAMLSMLEVHDEIPEELFFVVAEVIALSYWMRGLYPEGHPA